MADSEPESTAPWVTILTTRDLAKASTANGMLLEHGVEVRFFQVPPFEVQVREDHVESAKDLLKEWGIT